MPGTDRGLDRGRQSGVDPVAGQEKPRDARLGRGPRGLARRELGLMSPGETLFIIKDVADPSKK